MESPQPEPSDRVPDNIAWIDGAEFGVAEELYLTAVPDGRTVLLKDTARLIWLVAADGGKVIEDVAELVGVPTEQVAGEITTFLKDLTARGLLTRPEG